MQQNILGLKKKMQAPKAVHYFTVTIILINELKQSNPKYLQYGNV